MAMEIQVAEPLNEEEIRSMADDDIIDPYVEECLRAAQSGMERMSADADWFPFVAHLEWVEAREEYAVLIRDAADAELADLGHGLAGEEALVSQLRSRPRGAPRGAPRRSRGAPRRSRSRTTRCACGTGG